MVSILCVFGTCRAFVVLAEGPFSFVCAVSSFDFDVTSFVRRVRRLSRDRRCDISTARLKHIHFRPTPDSPEATEQLLVCFDVTVSPSPRPPQSTRNSEPRSGTPLMRQQVTAFCEIRSVSPPSSSHVDQSSICPTFPISPRSVCPASFCRQLINLVHEELFPTLPQHRSLLLISSSSCTKLHCRLPLSNHRVQMFHSFHEGLPVLPLGPALLFDCTTSVPVSSSLSETQFSNPVRSSSSPSTTGSILFHFRRSGHIMRSVLFALREMYDVLCVRI